jgi:hypothetical protein
MKADFSLEGYKTAIVYHTGSRSVLEVETNFSFVLNVSNVQHEPSGVGLEIVPGLQLRKATGAEIAAIKDVLEKQAGNDTYTPWQNSKVREADNRWSHTLLPEDLSIATVEFKLGFTLLRSAFPGQTKMPTLIFDAGRLFRKRAIVCCDDRATHTDAPSTVKCCERSSRPLVRGSW